MSILLSCLVFTGGILPLAAPPSDGFLPIVKVIDPVLTPVPSNYVDHPAIQGTTYTVHVAYGSEGNCWEANPIYCTLKWKVLTSYGSLRTAGFRPVNLPATYPAEAVMSATAGVGQREPLYANSVWVVPGIDAGRKATLKFSNMETLAVRVWLDQESFWGTNGFYYKSDTSDGVAGKCLDFIVKHD